MQGTDVVVSHLPGEFKQKDDAAQKLPPESQSTMRTKVFEVGDKPWIGPGGAPVGRRVIVSIVRHPARPAEKSAQVMSNKRDLKLGGNTVKVSERTLSLKTSAGATVDAPLTTVEATVNANVTVLITGEGIGLTDLVTFAHDMEVK